MPKSKSEKAPREPFKVEVDHARVFVTNKSKSAEAKFFGKVLNAVIAGIQSALRAWHEKEEKRPHSGVREYMEHAFTEYLHGLSTEEIRSHIKDLEERDPRVFDVVSDLQDCGVVLHNTFARVVRERSNWLFGIESADNPRPRPKDWSDTDDECRVKKYAGDIACVVTGLSSTEVERANECIKFSPREARVAPSWDVENCLEVLGLLHEAWFKDEDMFSFTDYAQDFVQRVIKAIERASRFGDVNGRSSKIDVEQIYRFDRITEIVGYIRVSASATLNAEGVIHDLTQALENYQAIHGQGGPQGAEEQDYDEDSERERVAKISDKTEQLPAELSFPAESGWTAWNVSSEDLMNEGKAQSHCVGDMGMGYAQAIASGKIQIWSVKDAQGKSKFTLEVGLNPSGMPSIFAQVKGKGNRLPGWAFADDYPPYGADAFRPRRESITRGRGPSAKTFPPVTPRDVRANEVEWLWGFIQQTIEFFHGQAGLEVMEPIIAGLESGKPEDLVATFNLLPRLCRDMMPGMTAVYLDRLYDERAESRIAPRSTAELQVGARGGTPLARRRRENPDKGAVGRTLEMRWTKIDVEPLF